MSAWRSACSPNRWPSRARAAAAIRARGVGRIQEVADGVRHQGRAARRDEQAGLARHDDVADRVHRRRHDRDAADHGLDHGRGQPLVPAGQREHVEGGQQFRDVAALAGQHHPDAGRLPGLRGDPPGQFPVTRPRPRSRPAGPAPAGRPGSPRAPSGRSAARPRRPRSRRRAGRARPGPRPGPARPGAGTGPSTVATTPMVRIRSGEISRRRTASTATPVPTQRPGR